MRIKKESRNTITSNSQVRLPQSPARHPASALWRHATDVASLDVDMPIEEEREAGVKVRVVVGEHRGLVSPLKPPTPVCILVVHVEAGSTFVHTVPSGWNAYAMTLSGSGSFNGGRSTAGLHAVSFDTVGDIISYRATEDSQFVLFSGRPIAEEVHINGTFVGNSSVQAYNFQMDYVQGRMGRLTPFRRQK